MRAVGGELVLIWLLIVLMALLLVWGLLNWWVY